jgi:glucose/arabinose dehydrogenase
MLAGEPTILVVQPRTGAINVDVDANLTAEFSEPMDAATINGGTIELRDQFGRNVSAVVSYDSATRTATLSPASDLRLINHYFTVTVKGGDAGIKDESGTAMAADFRWSFSTGTPEFQETTVFSSVINPTVVKFSPDGRAFVAEKSGRIWVFDNIEDSTPDLFANLHVNVHNFWDRGLLGMALSPDFPADPHIYVLYTYDGDIPGTTPGGNPAVAAPKFGDGVDLDDPGPGDVEQGAWVSGRLSRLTANGNFMSGVEEVLIHDWPQQFPSHSIGAIAFGQDGALYASSGEGASFLYADYGQPVPPNPGNPFGDPVNEGGALRSQDLLSQGDSTTLSGSIIRVDPTTGAALPTNPLFLSGNDENARRIIAHGLRNPFRFAFRPGTAEIWIADVGWVDWEEIDRIVSTSDSVIENFGWPAYEGPSAQSLFQDLDLPLLEELYAAGPDGHDEPYFAYHHSQKVDPTAEEPISRFASITGVAFGQGGNLPPAFDGAMFFGDWVRNFIWVMYAGVDGLPDPTNVRAFTSAALSMVNLEIGPDGSLYYPNFFGHTIQRLRFVDEGFAFNASVDDDALTLRASSDGEFLEIHSGNPPPPGSVPTFMWPIDASVPLPIDMLGGDDMVVVELPSGTSGPAGGIRLEAGTGTNRLIVKSGSVRIDSTATGGALDSSVADGAQLSTARLSQNALAIAGGGKVTILPGGAQASVITSLDFLAMLGGAPAAKDEGPATAGKLLAKDEPQPAKDDEVRGRTFGELSSLSLRAEGSRAETSAQQTLLDKPAVAPDKRKLFDRTATASSEQPARRGGALREHWRSQWHKFNARVVATGDDSRFETIAQWIAASLASGSDGDLADGRLATDRKPNPCDEFWLDEKWSRTAR